MRRCGGSPAKCVAALLALVMAGCSGGEDPSNQTSIATQPGTTQPVVVQCAEGDMRLPGTGLCQAEAAALLDSAVLYSGTEDGCSWTINETMLPLDEAFLYKAGSCQGRVTELAFAGGAQTATLGRVTSSVYETPDADYRPVR